MKKTMKFFSIAALALVGAVMTSCSSSDFDETQNQAQPQPAGGDNVVTLTTTVGMDGGETRALSIDYVNKKTNKIFAAGEQIAVVYENTSGTMVKAESEVLTDGDITNEGKSAQFTVTLTNPKADGQLKYIYPASMSTDGGDVNYTALNSQNGTLENISSLYDLAMYEGTFDGSNLRSDVTLDNKLAILALTLKDNIGSSEITSSITGLTVSDGSHTYNVTRSTGDGPIYVAMQPTASKTIEVTATDGTKTYAKALSSKTYAANSFHKLSWKMAEVIKGKFSVSSTKQVYFSKGNLRASKNTGVWSWEFAPNQWSRVGANSANTNITGNGTISVSGALYVDLFGWSTSTTHLGIHNSTNNSDYRTGSLTDGSDFIDWGSSSEVTATIGEGWRTLTSDEWRYLLVTRTTTSTKHYCKAKVNGVFGVIILPDDWSTSYHNLNKCDVTSLSFSDGALTDKITLEDWNSDFVPYGAVFLPTTGQRSGATVTNDNGRLYYWSSTGGINSNKVPIANQMYIGGDAVSPDTGAGRCNGNAVRLVRDVK